MNSLLSMNSNIISCKQLGIGTDETKSKVSLITSVTTNGDLSHFKIDAFGTDGSPHNIMRTELNATGDAENFAFGETSVATGNGSFVAGRSAQDGGNDNCVIFGNHLATRPTEFRIPADVVGTASGATGTFWRVTLGSTTYKIALLAD